jgi:hypothetical protein
MSKSSVAMFLAMENSPYKKKLNLLVAKAVDRGLSLEDVCDHSDVIVFTCTETGAKDSHCCFCSKAIK